jgi:hypothetical protein
MIVMRIMVMLIEGKEILAVDEELDDGGDTGRLF